MSEHFAHANNEWDGNSRLSMHSYQSAWMSHWTRRSNKESDHAIMDHPSTSGKETSPNACNPARELTSVKPGCSKMENKGLRMSSTIAGKETTSFQPVPMGDPNDESTSTTRDSHASSDFGVLRTHQNKHNLDFESTALSLKCFTAPPLVVAPDANLNPSKDGPFEAEGTTQNTEEHVKTYPFLGNSNFTIMRPSSKDLNDPSTELVQHGSGQVNELLSFCPSRVDRPALALEEQLPVTNPSFVDTEKMNFGRHSSFMACGGKQECHSNSGRPFTSYQQEKNASSSETDPCKINSQLPAASQHKFQEKRIVSGIRIFWNQAHHSVVAESGNLYNMCGSSPNLESVRICEPTPDSVVGLPEVQPRFSLKSAKWTDFDSYRLTASSRNLSESAGFNRSAFLQFRGMSCLGSGRQGVKIESLGSSSDGGGEENVEDHSGKSNDTEVVKPFDDSVSCKGKQVMDDLDQKNESSAETDTMDLDDFRGKKRLGVHSSGTSELLKLRLGTPHFSFGYTSKCKRNESKVSAKKFQFPPLPAPNNGDASSSRTQSLDIETLFSHSRSDRCLGGSFILEPGNQWIKRLRLSVSEPYSMGTKHLTMEELSSRNKRSPRKNPKGRLSCCEPTINDLHGKELMVLDRTTASARCSESSSKQKEGRLALASQSWIRRWFQNQSATQPKKPGGFVSCKPQRSKFTFEDLQERQLPSIGAMALMGKAMRGFQPCDLQRKGPVTVWNIRNF